MILLLNCTNFLTGKVLATDDGSRILAKYYSPPQLAPGTPANLPYPSVKEQKAFEKGLIEKTAKTTSDVILYDGRVVVFKPESDIMLYVVGNVDENEILLFKYAPYSFSDVDLANCTFVSCCV